MVNDPTTPLSLYGGTNLYNELDYVIFDAAVVTGSTQPNWAAAVNIGDKLTDGAAEWTLVSTTFSTDSNYGWSARPSDPYWDPLGIIARGVAAANAVTSASATSDYIKVAHVCNGQSDGSTSVANYGAQVAIYAQAAFSLATYLSGLGWLVYLGNSCGSTSDVALASGAYAGSYPAQLAQYGMNKCMADHFVGSTTVFRGADLFAEWGHAPVCYPESGTANSGVRVHLEEQYKCDFAHAIAKSLLVTAPFIPAP
jgi:hypothetical protein